MLSRDKKGYFWIPEDCEDLCMSDILYEGETFINAKDILVESIYT